MVGTSRKDVKQLSLCSLHGVNVALSLGREDPDQHYDIAKKEGATILQE